VAQHGPISITSGSELGGTWLADRHGAEEADRIVSAAEQAALHVPARGRWLIDADSFTNPRIMLYLADLWRRSRYGQALRSGGRGRRGVLARLSADRGYGPSPEADD
jgi:hypothetical protein